MLLLAAAAGLAAAGQVLLKLGADGRQSLMDFVNVRIGAGLLLYGMGTLLWIAALAREPLVRVYAFTALSFVLVYLASVFLLHERLAPVAAIGVAFVLVGLYLIAG
ncbi:EamA family transporter [Piscinibacter sp. XHJ-5]|uniref:EamA family transporter n=1 Tax=Piscinibacter sp. XHJ-5 TaxID=3037797 RepID=UPI002452B154|nr:EamA family transporter [Piscinibacter sp. XHJ-5]